MNVPSPGVSWLFNPDRNVWYRLDFELDKGGEGQVWAGTMHPSDFPVAIKIIHPTANAYQIVSSWYHDQDVHLKCLGHPGVVQTFDQFRSPQGDWVIVMERASSNLESLLRLNQPQSFGTVCSYGCQILGAVHHLHSRGIIHRDITPRNVLLFGADVVKINDFGVSKTNLPAGDVTRTVLGSKQYLPPELHRYGYWSHQSDIYQVGLVLLSLLLGKHAIPPNASDDLVKRMILDGVPRLMIESLIPTYGDLARTIRHMVCRTESLRYASALAVRSALLNVWTIHQNVLRAASVPSGNSGKNALSALAWLSSVRALPSSL